MCSGHLEKMRCGKQPQALEKAISCSAAGAFQADPHKLPSSPPPLSHRRGGILRASFLSPELQPGAPVPFPRQAWTGSGHHSLQAPGPPALSQKSVCRPKNGSFL